MKKCNCCRKHKEDVSTYFLPEVGYGSAFDCGVRGERTKFNVCPDCARKLNKWLKKKFPDLDINEFWKCNVVEIKDEDGNVYYEFENEDILLDLFAKFMPELIYGERNKLKRLAAFLGL